MTYKRWLYIPTLAAILGSWAAYEIAPAYFVAWYIGKVGMFGIYL